MAFRDVGLRGRCVATLPGQATTLVRAHERHPFVQGRGAARLSIFLDQPDVAL